MEKLNFYDVIQKVSVLYVLKVKYFMTCFNVNAYGLYSDTVYVFLNVFEP